jgi:hypothetical protein
LVIEAFSCHQAAKLEACRIIERSVIIKRPGYKAPQVGQPTAQGATPYHLLL